MTVRLDWPPEVVERLTHEARRKGVSLETYILESVLRQPNSPSTLEAKRLQREQAATRIMEIQRRVQPDPEGWTSREYIHYGRP